MRDGGFAVRGKGGKAMATLAEVRKESQASHDIPEPVITVEPGIYKEWWANPAVVGLMGFSTTTMATGLHNVGYWGAGPTMAMAIAFGGTAQFVAGVVDLRKGSLFGGSAFMAYGAFWWSLVVLDYLLPKTGISSGPNELFGYFLMWTLFTLSFFVASFKVGNHLAGLFGLLLVAFLLLDGVTLGKVPAVVAGWEIFITGLVAWYIATAILVNGVYGRKVLPYS
jgi:succinate-acetate transporter protein